jgi:hypothetical protein
VGDWSSMMDGQEVFNVDPGNRKMLLLQKVSCQ